MMDTLPPNAPSAEQAVLKAVLVDPEQFKKIRLSPPDFYTERHAWIFEAVGKILKKGQLPDFVTVCTELDAAGRLGPIGGREFILSLLTFEADSWNAAAYADIVLDRSNRRKVAEALGECIRGVYDEDSDLAAVAAKCMDTLARRASRAKGAVPIQEILGELWDEVDAAQKQPNQSYGIHTGFKGWDGITNGIQLGTVALLTGEPGIGKSVLAAQVTINAAEKGFPGAFYSLEMDPRQVTRRSLSERSKVSTHAIRSGRFTEEEYNQLVDAFEFMGRLPIHISRDSDLSTMDLRVDLMRLKDRAGIKLVVVDYEALLSDGEGVMNENDRSTLLSKRIHAIAKDLDVGIISIGDMVKAGITGERKGQAVAAGSGKSLHDRDEILVMTTVQKDKTSDQDDSEEVLVKWEKRREGPGNKFMRLIKRDGFPAFDDAPAAPKKSPNAQRPGEK